MWDIYCLVFACKHNMWEEETGSFFVWILHLLTRTRLAGVSLPQRGCQSGGGASAVFSTAVLKYPKENFIYFNELPAVMDVYTHLRVEFQPFFFPQQRKVRLSPWMLLLFFLHMSPFCCLYELCTSGKEFWRCPNKTKNKSHPQGVISNPDLNIIMLAVHVAMATSLTPPVFNCIHD